MRTLLACLAVVVAPLLSEAATHGRTLRRLAASALLSAAAPMLAHAQAVVEIDDRIGCSACAIEVGPSVTLAPPTGQVWFTSSPGINVARDRAGNYIVSQAEGDGLIAVFGSDGEYRSSFGRIGGGPGEFAASFPLLMEVGNGDVLYVIDPLRLHTLSPRAETTLDQVRMPVQARDAVVLTGGIAVQAAVRTDAGNTTIQIIRPDGTIEASIGVSETAAAPSEMGLESIRVLGRSNDHLDVWSAPVNRYRLVRYGRDGEEKTRIERDSESFRPYSDRNPGAPFHMPANPGVLAIHQDADGLLWVALVGPPSSFSPLGGVGGLRGEAPLNAYVDLNRFLHTTVEVLDPVAGELIARHAFDGYVKFVSTPDDDLFVYSLRPDSLGSLACIVTPLKLQRP